MVRAAAADFTAEGATGIGMGMRTVVSGGALEGITSLLMAGGLALRVGLRGDFGPSG